MCDHQHGARQKRPSAEIAPRSPLSAMFRALLLASAALCADAYVVTAARAAPLAARRAASPAMVFDMADLPATMNLLAEIVDSDGERVYGAVEAPGWVLPVGGLLAILTV